MSAVQLDHRPDGTTRFLAQTGLMGGFWFALHDVDLSSGHARKQVLGAACSTHRIFVQADQARWTYAFTPGEGRGLEIATLEQQLQAAHYTQPRSAARDGR